MLLSEAVVRRLEARCISQWKVTFVPLPYDKVALTRKTLTFLGLVLRLWCTCGSLAMCHCDSCIPCRIGVQFWRGQMNDTDRGWWIDWRTGRNEFSWTGQRKRGKNKRAVSDVMLIQTKPVDWQYCDASRSISREFTLRLKRNFEYLLWRLLVKKRPHWSNATDLACSTIYSLISRVILSPRNIRFAKCVHGDCTREIPRIRKALGILYSE